MKTRKVSWWVAECLDDHRCFNIRGRTRQEVMKQVTDLRVRRNDEVYGKCFVDDHGKARYGWPKKVTVEYTSTLDLVFTLLGEGGCES